MLPALSELPLPEAVPLIIQQAEGPDPFRRRLAIRAIAPVAALSPEAMKLLIEAIDSGDELAAMTALDAALPLGKDAAPLVPSLRPFLAPSE